MITAIWILLGISVITWILSFIAFCIGHCEVGFLGDEYWEYERWEKIYYKVFAPTGCVCILACVVLCIIQAGMSCK